MATTQKIITLDALSTFKTNLDSTYQKPIIAGDGITIGEDGKTISANITSSAFNTKADKTAAVGSIEMSIDDTSGTGTYVITLQAKDVNGDNLGTAQTIDLPLESIVVSAQYYNTYTYNNQGYSKVIVITLATTGIPIIVPVGDLVSGLQSEISTTNKLSSDLVDDSGKTHKFVTTAQINNFHTHSNKSVLDSTTASYTTDLNSKLSGISAGAQVNVIESVSVNGVEADVVAKSVNINVPTKVSQLSNDSGFTSNSGTITGITMNGVSKGTSGVVNLGTVITDISGKQDVLTFDSTPTNNSTNPVTSKGIFTALAGKQDALTFATTAEINALFN